jgi:polyisoprenoid-binding protein YceI
MHVDSTLHGPASWPLVDVFLRAVLQSKVSEVDGDFTIRGVTRAEKLTLTVAGKGTGSGTITGTTAFDRKQYRMNSGIPFIKIADRVEVDIALKGKRVSGPPLVLKK